MRFIRGFIKGSIECKKEDKMESCRNCNNLVELDIHGQNYECAKYVDVNGAQIMDANVIFAKVKMESKPAMCEEWEDKNDK